MTRKAEEATRRQLQAAAAGGSGGGLVDDVRLAWKYSEGQAQFGAGCTLFKHVLTGLIVEVFHGNGW